MKDMLTTAEQVDAWRFELYPGRWRVYSLSTCVTMWYAGRSLSEALMAYLRDTVSVKDNQCDWRSIEELIEDLDGEPVPLAKEMRFHHDHDQTIVTDETAGSLLAQAMEKGQVPCCICTSEW